MAHADRELPHIGTDEMGISMANDLRELIFVFGTQGHSGFSASYAIGILEKLLRHEPITPLTGEPSEWMEVGQDVFQNTRLSRVFKSHDRFNGQPYDIEAVIFREDSGLCFTGRGSQQPVTFPYSPKTIYIDVDADGNPINGWNREGICPEWAAA